jgi:hypothetical protein
MTKLKVKKCFRLKQILKFFEFSLYFIYLGRGRYFE